MEAGTNGKIWRLLCLPSRIVKSELTELNLVIKENEVIKVKDLIVKKTKKFSVMKRKIIFLAILSFFILNFANAGIRIKEKSKFNIVGSIVVENNTDSFSINNFKEENKRSRVYSYFYRKITDETFGADLKYDKVRMYIVRAKGNQPFKTNEALNYIKKMDGMRPSLPWALLAMKQHGDIWKQNTVVFTKQSILHKRKGFHMIPFIDRENGIYLYFREYPSQACDFIFIVPEDDEENKELSDL